MDGEVTVDGKIPLGSAKSSEGVARQVALSQWEAGARIKCRRRECCWIECFATRIRGSVQIERLTRDDVRPWIRKKTVGEQSKISVVYVNRWRGSGLDNSLDGPEPQHCI